MMKKLLIRIYRRFKNFNYSPLRVSSNGDRYIFVHINKTAGTSVSYALNFPHKMHFTIKELIDILGEEQVKNAFVFAFVRNPWEKVLSQYFHYIKTGQFNLERKGVEFFPEWVNKTYGDYRDEYYINDEKYFDTQLSWLRNSNGEIMVDYIGRYENLEDDFYKICAKLEMHKKLPHKNSSSKVDYRNYYDDSTRQIIESYFKEDINYFNYSF